MAIPGVRVRAQLGLANEHVRKTVAAEIGDLQAAGWTNVLSTVN